MYRIQEAITKLLFLFALLTAIGSGVYLIFLYSGSGTSEPDYDYIEIQNMVAEPSEPPSEELGPQPPTYDAEQLRSINDDFIGWLQIPDTTINYPVVQGTNNSYYLNHSFQKEYSRFGCPFLEFDTPADARSRVIHGHNMGVGREEMFSPLINYQDQTFAEDHQTLFFSEPNRAGEERYTLFAVLNLNIHDDFNYRQQVFSDEESFHDFIDFLKDNSIYTCDFMPTGNILILSTCNRVYGKDNRLLICVGQDHT